jgi:hypothetical protein
VLVSRLLRTLLTAVVFEHNDVALRASAFCSPRRRRRGGLCQHHPRASSDYSRCQSKCHRHSSRLSGHDGVCHIVRELHPFPLSYLKGEALEKAPPLGDQLVSLLLWHSMVASGGYAHVPDGPFSMCQMAHSPCARWPILRLTEHSKGRCTALFSQWPGRSLLRSPPPAPSPAHHRPHRLRLVAPRLHCGNELSE